LPNGIVGTYGFDSADQLTSLAYAKGSTQLGDLAYTYDAAGQRITQSGSLARLLMPSNPAGSLAAWASASYTWNARNQLVSTSWGNSTFAYDALGRRKSRTVNGTTTNYLYDGVNPVTVNSSLMLTGLSVDDYFARVSSGTVTSFLTDALGSTLALTDASASTTASYSYGVYGNASKTGTDDTPFQYTGRENDGAANLYYYRARYYNPTFGQFISADPLGLAGGINAYAYADGNPVSNTDALGLFVTSVDAACVQSPQLCAEIFGQIAQNAAATSGSACEQEAADAVAGAFQTVGNIAAILPALPPAALKSLARDASGKIHPPKGWQLPRIKDLKNAHPDTVKETADELRSSIAAREQEIQRLGEDPAHRAQVEKERSLLRSLQKYLGGFGGFF